MCSGRQISTDNRFSRLEETIWFLLIQLEVSALFCFRNKWCCHVTQAGYKGSGVPSQPCRAVWHLARRPANGQTAWVGSAPQVRVPGVFIGSYSAVGRQGQRQVRAVLLLVVTLSARENRCVFRGVCGWVVRLVDCGVVWGFFCLFWGLLGLLIFVCVGLAFLWDFFGVGVFVCWFFVCVLFVRLCCFLLWWWRLFVCLF